MAKNLPFVIQPRREAVLIEVGSEESGKISIPRKGYLTTGEKAFMQAAIGGDETTLKIISISRKISSNEGLTLEQAYNSTINILSGKGSSAPELMDIEEKYMDDFTDLMSLLTNMQTKEKLISALCMLKYRVNHEYDINDVLTLHPDMIDGLNELYDLEERKSIEGLQDLGKDSDKDDETPEQISAVEIEKKPRKPRIQN